MGCGFGASGIYLAKKYGAKATEITTSPAQVEMARKAAAADGGVKAKFVLMDAEDMKFDQTFDVAWSIESISHYPQKQKFFASVAQCLESGGTLALTDWFKKEQLGEPEHKKFIEPIEKGMLVELDTMQDYATFVKSNCMRVIYSEILNKNRAKTWDLCLDIVKKKDLWQVAAENGSMFVDFLQAFSAMRAGFASGNFVYGLICRQETLRRMWAARQVRLLPGKGREVHVSTGEDDAELRGAAADPFRQIEGRNNSRPQQRGDGHGARWLNDDFHTLPDQPRRGNDLLFADEENAFHVAAEDRESPWRQRSAQAVGDGVA